MSTEPAGPVAYDVGDQAELLTALERWHAARAMREEADAEMRHYQGLLLDGLPEDAARITVGGRPAVTVVTRTNSRFDRAKFDGDFPGLYETYVVPGRASRYLRLA